MFLFTVSNNSPIDEQVFVSIRYITNKYESIISKFQKKKIFGFMWGRPIKHDSALFSVYLKIHYIPAHKKQ